MNEKAFSQKLTETIIESVRVIPRPLVKALEKAAARARGTEKKVLKNILLNCRIARENPVPACQDTGVFEIWFKIGSDAQIRGVNFNSLADSALEKAHRDGGLRNSMPEGLKGIAHISFKSGKGIECVLTPRGFGSENYTFLHSLKPGAGSREIVDAVAGDAKNADARPCPPYLIGVGIGGTASAAAEMSARALTEINFCPEGIEKKIMDEVNKSGTGAGGVGGQFTALGVKVKKMPAHIAGVQLCVHIGCWCNRVGKFRFEAN